MRTLIQRAVLLAATPGIITAEDVTTAQGITAPLAATAPAGGPWALLQGDFNAGRLTLDSLNATLLRGALAGAGGKVAAPARLLGLTWPHGLPAGAK